MRSLHICQHCPAGTYPSTSSACQYTSCPVGFFTNMAEQSSCLQCPAGLTSTVGAVQCTAVTVITSPEQCQELENRYKVGRRRETEQHFVWSIEWFHWC